MLGSSASTPAPWRHPGYSPFWHQWGPTLPTCWLPPGSSRAALHALAGVEPNLFQQSGTRPSQTSNCWDLEPQPMSPIGTTCCGKQGTCSWIQACMCEKFHFPPHLICNATFWLFMYNKKVNIDRWWFYEHHCLRIPCGLVSPDWFFFLIACINSSHFPWINPSLLIVFGLASNQVWL